jgi:hypothetical protein
MKIPVYLYNPKLGKQIRKYANEEILCMLDSKPEKGIVIHTYSTIYEVVELYVVPGYNEDIHICACLVKEKKTSMFSKKERN